MKSLYTAASAFMATVLLSSAVASAQFPNLESILRDRRADPDRFENPTPGQSVVRLRQANLDIVHFRAGSRLRLSRDGQHYLLPITVRVKNTGTKAAPPSRLRVRLMRVQDIGEAPHRARITNPIMTLRWTGQRSSYYPWVGRLEPNRSCTLRGNLMIPRDRWAGFMGFEAEADTKAGEQERYPQGRVAESNESDNTSRFWDHYPIP